MGRACVDGVCFHVSESQLPSCCAVIHQHLPLDGLVLSEEATRAAWFASPCRAANLLLVTAPLPVLLLRQVAGEPLWVS